MLDEASTIEHTYQAYFAAFQTLDARAVVPYLYLPLTFIGPAQHVVVSTEDEASQMFARMMDALRTRGYARSGLDQIEVKQLADGLALVNIHGARYKADGSTMEGIAGLYTMRKAEGRWRIATVTIYDSSCPLQIR